ncbi:hypothetical protein [Kitasatospora viridis]|uniref:Uncharacterized protein n=1 Tax=Kitasatospora viridis TaxID=281105 RepID=A0A561S9U3_9ACTN|nr:hypothetical protein [Kitasatospora viridis]TWF71642.1 hypothetical protein FHX73_1813 [Kitasatospora viridis]
MTDSQWGADVPVSMPQPLPPDLVGLVPMTGFTMTLNGLWPDLSQADWERISRPTYAPYDPALQEDAPAAEAADHDREWT